MNVVEVHPMAQRAVDESGFARTRSLRETDDRCASQRLPTRRNVDQALGEWIMRESVGHRHRIQEMELHLVNDIRRDGTEIKRSAEIADPLAVGPAIRQHHTRFPDAAMRLAATCAMISSTRSRERSAGISETSSSAAATPTMDSVSSRNFSMMPWLSQGFPGVPVQASVVAITSRPFLSRTAT